VYLAQLPATVILLMNKNLLNIVVIIDMYTND